MAPRFSKRLCPKQQLLKRRQRPRRHIVRYAFRQMRLKCFQTDLMNPRIGLCLPYGLAQKGNLLAIALIEIGPEISSQEPGPDQESLLPNPSQR